MAVFSPLIQPQSPSPLSPARGWQAPPALSSQNPPVPSAPQEKAVGGDRASKEGQLGMILPAGEQLGINEVARGIVRGLSGRMVRGNQAGRQASG